MYFGQLIVTLYDSRNILVHQLGFQEIYFVRKRLAQVAGETSREKIGAAASPLKNTVIMYPRGQREVQQMSFLSNYRNNLVNKGPSLPFLWTLVRCWSSEQHGYIAGYNCDLFLCVYQGFPA